MGLPVARVGIYLLLTVVAMAAVTAGLARRRKSSDLEERAHACWGASAG